MRSVPRQSAATWVAVLVAYGFSLWFARYGLGTRAHGADVSLYATDAHAIADGRLPYRDLYFEYPPGALPPLLIPEPAADYAQVFKILMAVVGAGMLVACDVVLRAQRLSRLWRLLAVAVAPLAVGSVFLNRYDVWPAFLTVTALALVIARRPVAAFATLAVGVVAKVFSIAMAPAALVYAHRTYGGPVARRAFAALVAVAVLAVLPFAALGPGGVAFTFYIQATRHLQVESLGGSLLLVAARLGLYHADVRTGKPGSLDLFGGLPSAVGVVSVVVVVALVGWVAWSLRRGEASVERFVAAAAASVAVYVAFGKVLSPQYLVWLVPLVPLVAGVRGRIATLLLLGALVLTQFEFDHRHAELQTVGPVVWVVLARNLLLVALTLVVVQAAGATQTSKPGAATRV